MKRQISILGLSMALVLLASACGIGRADKGNQPMQLEMIDGSATIIRGDQSIRVTGSSPVSTGDTIAMTKGSLAELTLGEGRSMELDGAKIEVISSSKVRHSAGELLSEGTSEITVDAETLTVYARRATFRVDRALATRVAVYEGKQAKISGVGETLLVPRYREAVVAGGIFPRAPKPLKVDPKDRWDRRLLQGVIDLDNRLANFARGLEAQLGEAGGIEFFQKTEPNVDLSFLPPYLSNRRSDVLIGLSFATEAEASANNGVGNVFAQMMQLWGEGATWGLIAHEFHVKHDGVFGRLLEAVKQAGLFTPGGLGPAFSSTTRPRARRTQSTNRGGGGGGPSPTSQPPTDPPSPIISPLPTTGVPIVDDLLGNSDGNPNQGSVARDRAIPLP